MEENKSSYKRLFIALELKNSQQMERISNWLQVRLKDEKIHWNQAKNSHLTIKFLGKTETEKIKSIIEILEKNCKQVKPFELEYGKIGLFGSKYAPKIIWIEGKTGGILENLEKNLKKDLEKIGYDIDNQNFVSHITLGKIHSALKSRKYFQSIIDQSQEQELLKEKIDKIILFSSILTKNGPIYRHEYKINL